jgi:hypothetical protein
MQLLAPKDAGLREESISRTLAAFPEPGASFEKNIANSRKLGSAGCRKLLAGS